MDLKAMAKGISAGVTAGAAVYTIYSTAAAKKRKMKSRASKAFDAVGEMIDNITEMLS